jgi:ATP-dependent Lon protease
VPEDNRKDVQELQAEVTNGLNIVYVAHADEAVRVAFADTEATASTASRARKTRR